MPLIAYIEKKFHGESLNLIQKINGVISDYNAQGYSLTLRQVYYQMVARAIIENNERSYKNLGNLISEARLAGLVDWYAIEDRTRNLRGNSHWGNPGDIISASAYSYRIDKWENQRDYVEVWVEKDALVGIVGQICNELDVYYFSCRGYVSQSEMWTAAQRLARISRKRKAHILHLGDHDPSGRDMSRDIQERLALFGASVTFDRLALNMDQIEEFNPPPNPTKITDSRSNGYIAEFGHECWELDALEPRVITDLIRENVLQYRDGDQYALDAEQERGERKILKELADNWSTVESHWTQIKRDWDIGDEP